MKNNLRNNKRPLILAGVLLMAFAVLLMLVFIRYYFAEDYLTVEVLEERMKEYLSSYDNLSELDIKILSNNLSKQIDDQIANLDLGNLSEDDLRELMKMVNSELQYADYAIPQDELYRLTVNIVKNILESGYYEAEDYEDIINELAAQLEILQQAISKIDTSDLTIEDIQNIVNQSGLDEITVKNWISKTEKAGKDYTDYKISELAKQLGIDEETLKQLIKESLEHDESLAYLANKLDITINKLNDLFSKYDVTDLNELYAHIQQMERHQVNLQKQIDYNLSVTTSSITAVSNQISENKKETDAKINENKESTDARIDANQKATDEKIDKNRKAADEKIDTNQKVTDEKIDANQKVTDEKIDANQKATNTKIEENKAYTDQQIKELQDNVLFYRYDRNTNTLYMFGREGEE